MSSHDENKQTTASPHFVSITLVLTFIITFILISVGTLPPVFVVADEDEPVAVADIATDVPSPTETTIPPTPTITPTSIPTNTPTDVPTATILPTVEPTLEPTTATNDTTSTTDAGYDPDVVAQGESLFVSCAACHGAEGQGLPNLGKNLVESEFVHNLSDDELVDFIKTGRPIWDPENTTGIDMPPKGGNPILTDDDLYAIVAYLRSLGTTPDSENATEVTPVEQVETESSDTGSYDPDVVAHGQSLFVSCAACHGQHGLGLPNLGKSLVDSEFVDSQTDDELVDFITTGRPIWDPLNTTGIDMPPKGGNPTLTDEDIYAIVTYIRSLND